VVCRRSIFYSVPVLSDFFVPDSFESAIAGPEEAKNPAGKYPPPHSDPLYRHRVFRKFGLLVNTIRPILDVRSDFIRDLFPSGTFKAVKRSSDLHRPEAYNIG
jgi:hypothetical protein